MGSTPQPPDINVLLLLMPEMYNSTKKIQRRTPRKLKPHTNIYLPLISCVLFSDFLSRDNRHLWTKEHASCYLLHSRSEVSKMEDCANDMDWVMVFHSGPCGAGNRPWSAGKCWPR